MASRTPDRCHLHLVKKTPAHRHPNRTRGHAQAEVFGKQQSKPWLIATHWPPELFGPQAITAWYGRRMQIELAFRDRNFNPFGFVLATARSRNIERFNVLTLLAAWASIGL
ncbi:MAG: transposase [Gammaproteobacteria bacterium]|nr:transposase [Gammaproteobacteria bacterium]